MAGRRVSAPAARAVRASVRVAAVARCALPLRRYNQGLSLIPAARPRARPARAATSRLSTTTGCARTRPSWPSASWAGPVRAPMPQRAHALALTPPAALQCRPTSPSPASAASRSSACSWDPSAPTWSVHTRRPRLRLLACDTRCCRPGAARARCALPSRGGCPCRCAACRSTAASARKRVQRLRAASSLSPSAGAVGLRAVLTPGGRRRTSRPARRWTTSSGCT